MRLFDTHVHLNDERFDVDREALIAQLQGNGVVLAVNAGTNLQTSQEGIELHQKYPFIYATVGFHPHDAKLVQGNDLQLLAQLAKQEGVVAVGEIGLDYHYDFSPREVQREVFAQQLQVANATGLPYTVHSREAHADTLSIIREANMRTQGEMHCFSGSVQMAEIYLDMGFMISFAGPVTYKNAHNLVEVARYVPVDRILIETDCPYLAPVPMRGKRNQPDFVQYTAQQVANIKGIDFETFCEQTLQNGMKFFAIKN